jgi:hypothetical protein
MEDHQHMFTRVLDEDSRPMFDFCETCGLMRTPSL